jgi:hypothetical protein
MTDPLCITNCHTLPSSEYVCLIYNTGESLLAHMQVAVISIIELDITVCTHHSPMREYLAVLAPSLSRPPQAPKTCKTKHHLSFMCSSLGRMGCLGEQRRSNACLRSIGSAPANTRVGFLHAVFVIGEDMCHRSSLSFASSPHPHLPACLVLSSTPPSRLRPRTPRR